MRYFIVVAFFILFNNILLTSAQIGTAEGYNLLFPNSDAELLIRGDLSSNGTLKVLGNSFICNGTNLTDLLILRDLRVGGDPLTIPPEFAADDILFVNGITTFHNGILGDPIPPNDFIIIRGIDTEGDVPSVIIKAADGDFSTPGGDINITSGINGSVIINNTGTINIGPNSTRFINFEDDDTNSIIYGISNLRKNTIFNNSIIVNGSSTFYNDVKVKGNVISNEGDFGERIDSLIIDTFNWDISGTLTVEDAELFPSFTVLEELNVDVLHSTGLVNILDVTNSDTTTILGDTTFSGTITSINNFLSTGDANIIGDVNTNDLITQYLDSSFYYGEDINGGTLNLFDMDIIDLLQFNDISSELLISNNLNGDILDVLDDGLYVNDTLNIHFLNTGNLTSNYSFSRGKQPCDAECDERVINIVRENLYNFNLSFTNGIDVLNDTISNDTNTIDACVRSKKPIEECLPEDIATLIVNVSSTFKNINALNVNNEGNLTIIADESSLNGQVIMLSDINGINADFSSNVYSPHFNLYYANINSLHIGELLFVNSSSNFTSLNLKEKDNFAFCANRINVTELIIENGCCGGDLTISSLLEVNNQTYINNILTTNIIDTEDLFVQSNSLFIGNLLIGENLFLNESLIVECHGKSEFFGFFNISANGTIDNLNVVDITIIESDIVVTSEAKLNGITTDYFEAQSSLEVLSTSIFNDSITIDGDMNIQGSLIQSNDIISNISFIEHNFIGPLTKVNCLDGITANFNNTVQSNSIKDTIVMFNISDDIRGDTFLFDSLLTNDMLVSCDYKAFILNVSNNTATHTIASLNVEHQFNALSTQIDGTLNANTVSLIDFNINNGLNVQSYLNVDNIFVYNASLINHYGTVNIFGDLEVNSTVSLPLLPSGEKCAASILYYLNISGEGFANSMDITAGIDTNVLEASQLTVNTDSFVNNDTIIYGSAFFSGRNFETNIERNLTVNGHLSHFNDDVFINDNLNVFESITLGGSAYINELLSSNGNINIMESLHTTTLEGTSLGTFNDHVQSSYTNITDNVTILEPFIISGTLSVTSEFTGTYVNVKRTLSANETNIMNTNVEELIVSYIGELNNLKAKSLSLSNLIGNDISFDNSGIIQIEDTSNIDNTIINDESHISSIYVLGPNSVFTNIDITSIGYINGDFDSNNVDIIGDGFIYGNTDSNAGDTFVGIVISNESFGSSLNADTGGIEGDLIGQCSQRSDALCVNVCNGTNVGGNVTVLNEASTSFINVNDTTSSTFTISYGNFSNSVNSNEVHSIGLTIANNINISRDANIESITGNNFEGNRVTSKCGIDGISFIGDNVIIRDLYSLNMTTDNLIVDDFTGEFIFISLLTTDILDVKGDFTVTTSPEFLGNLYTNDIIGNGSLITSNIFIDDLLSGTDGIFSGTFNGNYIRINTLIDVIEDVIAESVHVPNVIVYDTLDVHSDSFLGPITTTDTLSYFDIDNNVRARDYWTENIQITDEIIVSSIETNTTSSVQFNVGNLITLNSTGSSLIFDSLNVGIQNVYDNSLIDNTNTLLLNVLNNSEISNNLHITKYFEIFSDFNVSSDQRLGAYCSDHPNFDITLHRNALLPRLACPGDFKVKSGSSTFIYRDLNVRLDIFGNGNLILSNSGCDSNIGKDTAVFGGLRVNTNMDINEQLIVNGPLLTNLSISVNGNGFIPIITVGNTTTTVNTTVDGFVNITNDITSSSSIFVENQLNGGNLLTITSDINSENGIIGGDATITDNINAGNLITSNNLQNNTIGGNSFMNSLTIGGDINTNISFTISNVLNAFIGDINTSVMASSTSVNNGQFNNNITSIDIISSDYTVFNNTIIGIEMSILNTLTSQNINAQNIDSDGDLIISNDLLINGTFNLNSNTFVGEDLLVEGNIVELIGNIIIGNENEDAYLGVPISLINPINLTIKGQDSNTGRGGNIIFNGGDSLNDDCKGGDINLRPCLSVNTVNTNVLISEDVELLNEHNFTVMDTSTLTGTILQIGLNENDDRFLSLFPNNPIGSGAILTIHGQDGSNPFNGGDIIITPGAGGNININGDNIINWDTNIDGSLSISGITNFFDELNVGGNMNIDFDIYNITDLIIGENIIISSNASIDGDNLILGSEEPECNSCNNDFKIISKSFNFTIEGQESIDTIGGNVFISGGIGISGNGGDLFISGGGANSDIEPISEIYIGEENTLQVNIYNSNFHGDASIDGDIIDLSSVTIGGGIISRFPVNGFNGNDTIIQGQNSINGTGGDVHIQSGRTSDGNWGNIDITSSISFGGDNTDIQGILYADYSVNIDDILFIEDGGTSSFIGNIFLGDNQSHFTIQMINGDEQQTLNILGQDGSTKGGDLLFIAGEGEDGIGGNLTLLGGFSDGDVLIDAGCGGQCGSCSHGSIIIGSKCTNVEIRDIPVHIQSATFLNDLYIVNTSTINDFTVSQMFHSEYLISESIYMNILHSIGLTQINDAYFTSVSVINDILNNPNASFHNIIINNQLIVNDTYVSIPNVHVTDDLTVGNDSIIENLNINGDFITPYLSIEKIGLVDIDITKDVYITKDVLVKNNIEVTGDTFIRGNTLTVGTTNVEDCAWTMTRPPSEINGYFSEIRGQKGLSDAGSVDIFGGKSQLDLGGQVNLIGGIGPICGGDINFQTDSVFHVTAGGSDVCKGTTNIGTQGTSNIELVSDTAIVGHEFPVQFTKSSSFDDDVLIMSDLNVIGFTTLLNTNIDRLSILSLLTVSNSASFNGFFDVLGESSFIGSLDISDNSSINSVNVDILGVDSFIVEDANIENVVVNELTDNDNMAKRYNINWTKELLGIGDFFTSENTYFIPSIFNFTLNSNITEGILNNSTGILYNSTGLLNSTGYTKRYYNNNNEFTRFNGTNVTDLNDTFVSICSSFDELNMLIIDELIVDTFESTEGSCSQFDGQVSFNTDISMQCGLYVGDNLSNTTSRMTGNTGDIITGGSATIENLTSDSLEADYLKINGDVTVKANYGGNAITNIPPTSNIEYSSCRTESQIVIPGYEASWCNLNILEEHVNFILIDHIEDSDLEYQGLANIFVQNPQIGQIITIAFFPTNTDDELILLDHKEVLARTTTNYLSDVTGNILLGTTLCDDKCECHVETKRTQKMFNEEMINEQSTRDHDPSVVRSLTEYQIKLTYGDIVQFLYGPFDVVLPSTSITEEYTVSWRLIGTGGGILPQSKPDFDTNCAE